MRIVFLIIVADKCLRIAYGSTVWNWLTSSSHLLEHMILLLLDAETLEVTPFGENLHGLNILDRSQVIAVVFVATKAIETN